MLIVPGHIVKKKFGLLSLRLDKINFHKPEPVYG